MKTLIAALVLSSSLVLAAPPPAAPPAGKTGPAKWEKGGDGDHAARREDRQRKMRLALVVGIADALEISDPAEALKLSDRIKSFDDRRAPLREQMGEAMKTLRAAADGDQAALPQVDAAIARVLDGRAQMAALDKEMVSTLSVGQTPQKRARLALFLARFHQEAMARMHEGGGGGRRMHNP